MCFPIPCLEVSKSSASVNDDITLVLLHIALSYRPLSITFRFYLDIDSSVALTSSRQLFRSFFLIFFPLFILPTLFPSNKPATSSHVLCDVQRTHSTFRVWGILPLCKDNLCYYADRAWWIVFYSSGICCIISPSNSLPFACLLRLIPSDPHVPHCLKKNAVCCSCAC